MTDRIMHLRNHISCYASHKLNSFNPTLVQWSPHILQFVVSTHRMKYHLPEAVAVLLICCSIAHAKEHFWLCTIAITHANKPFSLLQKNKYIIHLLRASLLAALVNKPPKWSSPELQHGGLAFWRRQCLFPLDSSVQRV
jgi:hypothetical protein